MTVSVFKDSDSDMFLNLYRWSSISVNVFLKLINELMVEIGIEAFLNFESSFLLLFFKLSMFYM